MHGVTGAVVVLTLSTGFALPGQGPVQLLADVNDYAPPLSSSPNGLTRAGLAVYTIADLPVLGTRLVRLAVAGPRDSEVALDPPLAGVPTPLAGSPSGLYFSLVDGPDAGTWFLPNHRQTARRLTAVVADHAVTLGARCVFTTVGAAGVSVWRSFGTAGSTRQLGTFPGEFVELVAAGGRAFCLLADALPPQRRVVTTDGTVSGTAVAVLDGQFGRLHPLPNGRLVWRRFDAAFVEVLGAADPAQPVVLVRRLEVEGVDFRGVAGGRVWFEVPGATPPERALLVTDGTLAGTAVVLARPFSWGYEPIGRLGGRLYAASRTGLGGVDLFAVDPQGGPPTFVRAIDSLAWFLVDGQRRSGIPAGRGFFTRSSGGWAYRGLDPMRDVEVPYRTSNAAFVAVAVGPRVWFTNDEPAAGAEIWSTDGTAAGTKLLFDLDPRREPDTLSSDPGGFTRGPHGAVWFSAVGRDGRRLVYRADSAFSGAEPVVDGVDYRRATALLRFGDHVYFSALRGSDMALLRVGHDGVVDEVATLPSPLHSWLVASRAFLGFTGLHPLTPITVWRGSGNALTQVVVLPTSYRAEGRWLGDRWGIAAGAGVAIADPHHAAPQFAPLIGRATGIVAFNGGLFVHEAILAWGNLLRLDPATGSATTIASLGVSPAARLIASPCALFVTSFAETRIYDRSGGELIVPHGGDNAVRLGRGVLVAGSGDLVRIGPDGQVTTLLQAAADQIEPVSATAAYFTTSGIGGPMLWSTDGTPIGTRVVANVAAQFPPRDYSAPQAPPALQAGKLWFAAYGPGVGVEPHFVQPAFAAEPIAPACGPARAPLLVAGRRDVDTLELEVGTSAAGGAFAWFAVSEPPAATALLGGCEVVVDLARALTAPAVALVDSVATVTIDLPSSPILLGLVVHAQVALGPTDAALGVDLSNGLRLELGPQ